MGGVDVTRRIRGAGPQMILAVLDHALHANRTLVDRVDLATKLSLSSLDRLPVSRLLLPRSGLSRSDFVRWHKSAWPAWPAMSGPGGILLQKSKVASVRIFGETLKCEALDDSDNLSRATEVAHEFCVRR
jgi:predicted nucleotidyltransferase